MAFQCHRTLFLYPKGEKRDMGQGDPKAAKRTGITLNRIQKELLQQIEEQINTNNSIRNNPEKTYRAIIQNSSFRF